MKKPIRIAIAEDHDLFRQGLVSLLDHEEEIQVVLDVGNGQELIDQLRKQRVNVVIMDLEMPVLNGQSALKIIRSKLPAPKVIILSMHYSDEFISETIRLGASGFLPKNCSIDKMVDAIYAVHEQGYYFDDKVSKELLFKLVRNDDFKPTFQTENISEREREILDLICAEKTNLEIADMLNISNRTVEVHRKNLLKKTNAKNVVGLVIYAIKNGFYQVHSKKKPSME